MQAYAGTMAETAVGTMAARPVAATRAVAQAKVTAPGATASVVWGILGLFIMGFILGGVALARAAAAKKLIEQHPDQYTGSGLATTGTVLGVLDLIGAVVGLIMLMAS